jgi:uncharacterized membrane protein
VAVAAAQIWMYYARLPDTLASHFDGRGTPNGWQTKGVFFGFYLGGIVLAAALCYGVPKMVAAMPYSLIHLSHKEYWLSPERRADTLAYIANFFAWFSCAVFFVEVTAVEYAIRANLAPDQRFAASVLWWVLGGFFAFVVVWIGRFIAHFAKRP